MLFLNNIKLLLGLSFLLLIYQDNQVYKERITYQND